MFMRHPISYAWAVGIVFLSHSVFAGNKMIETQTKLESVTVYLNAAELTHQGKIDLPRGTNTLVITNLSPQAQEETLQVAFEREGVKILSSQFSIENLSLEELTAFNPAAQEVLKDYRTLLDKNFQLAAEKVALEQVLAGLKNQLDNPTDAMQGNTQKFGDFLQFVYEKQKENDLRLKKLLEELQILSLQIQRSRERLQEFGIRIGQQYQQGRVILSVRSEEAVSTKLYVRYLANEARWRHSYEIRGDASEKPLKLVSRASIAQNTGLAWEDIKLRLVYGSAQVYQETPRLSPWTLYPEVQKTYQYAQKRSLLGTNTMAPTRMVPMAEKERAVEDVLEDGSSLSSMDVDVSSGMLNVSYDINIPYNVLSNGREHLIEIQEIELPAEYRYFAIPKLDTQVYLIATIKDYNKYGLFSSPANVVFEKMRSGTTYLTPANQTNELPITLGAEPRVAVERKVVSDKSSDTFLSSNRERIITYDLLVRNNKKSVVTLTLKDQYPLSSEENIKVDLLESSGASIDSQKGELTWELTLNPGEGKNLRLSFRVRYPKNMHLSI